MKSGIEQNEDVLIWNYIIEPPVGSIKHLRPTSNSVCEVLFPVKWCSWKWNVPSLWFDCAFPAFCLSSAPSQTVTEMLLVVDTWEKPMLVEEDEGLGWREETVIYPNTTVLCALTPFSLLPSLHFQKEKKVELANSKLQPSPSLPLAVPWIPSSLFLTPVLLFFVLFPYSFAVYELS